MLFGQDNRIIWIMVIIFDSQLVTVEFIVFGVVTDCQTLIVRVKLLQACFPSRHLPHPLPKFQYFQRW